MAPYIRDGKRVMAYVWAPSAPGRVTARFFFPKHGALLEDPGTGSACANLGGWWLATGKPVPATLEVAQGDAVGKPCRLFLEITAGRQIRVAGDVVELGRGEIRLP